MPWKDKEKEAAYKKAYYEKNRERLWSYGVRKESAKKYRIKNAEKLREYGKEYYWDNKQKQIASNKTWRELNADYVKQRDHKKVELLTDAYMKKHLLKLGYTRSQIRKHPELIETHRLIIKTKRLCKTSNN